MFFNDASHQLETCAEFIMQRVGIVFDGWKSTAHIWPIRAERSDDYVSAWLHRIYDLPHISQALFRLGKKKMVALAREKGGPREQR